jgi:hypothetical protein
MTFKNLACFVVLLSMPAYAQFKTYSEWAPTNEPGVEYRWVVDEIVPRVCTVQIRDTDVDGNSKIRVAFNYRLQGHRSSVISLMKVSRGERERAERMLLSCAFVDRIYVESIARR